MKELIELGHAVQVEVGKMKVEDGSTYYVPYLSIVRQEKLTSKIRNVLNSACKTENGVSLNDTIFKGPPLQALLTDVIDRMRFETHFINSVAWAF